MGRAGAGGVNTRRSSNGCARSIPSAKLRSRSAPSAGRCDAHSSHSSCSKSKARSISSESSGESSLSGEMNLPLNFDTAEPWQTIVKIALMIAAVYTIALISLFLKGNLLGGSLLVLFGLAFYAMLRRARRILVCAVGGLMGDG